MSLNVIMLYITVPPNVHLFDKESLLPRTDPRDAEAESMLNIQYRIIW